MEEEPIGAHEIKKSLPPDGSVEPSDNPNTSPHNTNWAGGFVSRKEMIVAMSAMSVFLLLIQLASIQKESRDIASVRSEYRAGSDAILNEIRTNNREAIERSKASAARSDRLSAAMNQLLGKTDTLVRELSVQESKP